MFELVAVEELVECAKRALENEDRRIRDASNGAAGPQTSMG